MGVKGGRLRTRPPRSLGEGTGLQGLFGAPLIFVYMMALSHYFKLMIKTAKLQLMHRHLP